MQSRQERFLGYIMQTSEEPVLLNISKAEGIYLFTEEGKPIIDMISGIGVSNLGHGNKDVVNAIEVQAKSYLHTMVYGEFVQGPQVDLAEKLVAHTPAGLDSVFFVNSGSEAIEGAMKLAKRYTGRAEIVAMKNAYHGSSHGALSLMSDQYFSNFYRPLLPGIKFMDFNVSEQCDMITEETAAVVVEPVQGEAGYIPANGEFLTALRKRCDEVGAILIFDEIQTGMGRTGSLYACEDYMVTPDILCTAKALGAGTPLGAFIAQKEIAQSFKKNPVLGHITTFGGHPLSCAAALAGLNYILDNNLLSEVNEKSGRIRENLTHASISEISGKGLMLSATLPDEPFLKAVVHECLENGLMIDWFLYADYKLRLAPPLTITFEEIDKACEIITQAIEKVTKHRNQTAPQ